MRLQFNILQWNSLKARLVLAGAREIGGQLFGEQIEPSLFMVTDITVQSSGGSFARFIVDIYQAVRDAFQFFERTHHQYRRYNYIGEWHSHPSFELLPSRTDIDSMLNLVSDEAFVGNFSVLVIVKLEHEAVRAAGWVFSNSLQPSPVQLEVLS